MAKKKKLSYWELRAVKQENDMQKNLAKTQNTIAKAYLDAQKYLTDEANKLFKRLESQNDMTEQEAKTALNARVSDSSILEYKRLANQIETPELQKWAQKQLYTLAMKSRITRIEDLRAKSYLVAKRVADIEYKEQTNFYIDVIHDSYKNAVAEDVVQQLTQKGITFEDWKTSNIVPIEVWNKKNIATNGHELKELSTEYTKNILESHWKGSNYSKRIWGDTDALAKRLEHLFTVESMTGMSEREMAQMIAKEFSTSTFVAKRLIRTEANYMSTQGKLKAWQAQGIEKYQIIAILDLRTSKICRHEDKKVYLVKDMKIGVNAPPFHVFCRSSVIAYYEERSNKGATTVRDPISGESFTMPSGTTYTQWMKELLKTYSMDEIKAQKRKILGKTL